jgi:hypothetical protein
MTYKYYSWSVTMNDGARINYEFEMDEAAPWTAVLKRFASFLDMEEYSGVSQKIEDICAEYEEILNTQLDGDSAFKELHG